MRIITRKRLTDFSKKHTDADLPLSDWYYKTKDADWNSLNDIKNTFNSVDYVGNDNYVFNIKGNSYRLIARILFKIKTVYIRFVGTHKEYDKIDDCSQV